MLGPISDVLGEVRGVKGGNFSRCVESDVGQLLAVLLSWAGVLVRGMSSVKPPHILANVLHFALGGVDLGNCQVRNAIATLADLILNYFPPIN